jgi:hypothetical protein
MSKFNKTGTKPAMKSGPMTTTEVTTNHAGGVGYVRDAKGELFTCAVTNMVGEDTFYESAKNRDDRFAKLVHEVTLQDPAWMYRFLGWLRNSANMRSASVVAAAEAVKVRNGAGITESFTVGERQLNTRDFIPQGMARADEPGELMAYWTQKYGRSIPWPVKRGISLAIEKLFDEYAYSKYGRNSGPGTWGLADLVELNHTSGKDERQGDLFRHALNERHNRSEPIPASLTMLQSRQAVMEIPQEDRKKFLQEPDAMERLKAAGLTWESLSGWIDGELDASFWEAVIPSMGYMALLRNLRNFDRAGISREVARKVADKLADPAQVAKSRQFPYRFLSAYRAINNDRWVTALSDALDASVGALPKFPGRTLVLVDTSASMRGTVSDKSQVRHIDVGALFGVALSTGKNDVELYGFANGVFKHDIPRGSSILRQIKSFDQKVGSVGHGTETVAALRAAYKGHDRVILVSDMQPFADYTGYGWGRKSNSVSDTVPAHIPFFGINTTGYKTTALDLSKPNRFEIGGFSDQVFRMIGLLAEGQSGNWPF